MERHGDEVHITTEEASAGRKPHIVRYVLAISLVLAVVALSVIWITGAVSSDENRPKDAATAEEAALGS